MWLNSTLRPNQVLPNWSKNTVPEKLVHLVLVNGTYIAADQRSRRTLQEGDVLAIWPPIAGG